MSWIRGNSSSRRRMISVRKEGHSTKTFHDIYGIMESIIISAVLEWMLWKSSEEDHARWAYDRDRGPQSGEHPAGFVGMSGFYQASKHGSLCPACVREEPGRASGAILNIHSYSTPMIKAGKPESQKLAFECQDPSSDPTNLPHGCVVRSSWDLVHLR